MRAQPAATPAHGPHGNSQSSGFRPSGPDVSQSPEYAREASPGVWRLELWVQPGAKRTAVAGVADGRLRVRVAAPAVEGKANQALMKFLSDRLGVRIGQLELVVGETGRRKSVLARSGIPFDWQSAFPTSEADAG